MNDKYAKNKQHKNNNFFTISENLPNYILPQ